MFQVRHTLGSTEYEVWARQLFGKFKWQFVKSFQTRGEAWAYIQEWEALGEKNTRTTAEIIASLGKSC